MFISSTRTPKPGYKLEISLPVKEGMFWRLCKYPFSIISSGEAWHTLP